MHEECNIPDCFCKHWDTKEDFALWTIRHVYADLKNLSEELSDVKNQVYKETGKHIYLPDIYSIMYTIEGFYEISNDKFKNNVDKD